jgi:hypothetical protein
MFWFESRGGWTISAAALAVDAAAAAADAKAMEDAAPRPKEVMRAFASAKVRCGAVFL